MDENTKLKLSSNFNIFNTVIKNDLCIGCGACFYNTSANIKEMKWNNEGFLVPTSETPDAEPLESLEVCPFNPFPSKEVRTEDEIANIFLPNTPKYDQIVGRYYNTYAGYSKKYRLTSSSGGIITYLINKLLETQIVDAVITVKYGNESFYEYSIIETSEELLSSSETKYYPVTMAKVLSQIRTSNKKFAVVGVACFIKSIRLLQRNHPEFKDKTPFLIGIICGGVKSRFYTEYLAGKAGVNSDNIKNPRYRIKNYNSTAGDYSFRCTDKKENKDFEIKMVSVGDMWGSGMFKAKACDFCDDLTTELADVSLGDAWIPPYNKDGKGTNVIITRSLLGESIIEDGLKEKELVIDKIPLYLFLRSQRGNFNHRHLGLRYRMRKAKKKGDLLPPKRHDKYKISLDFKLVQRQRLIIRKKSLEFWALYKNNPEFDHLMDPKLKKLKKLTRFYHIIRAIKKKYLND